MRCTKCGGRVIKICGSCGFELSAAKRYCDSCGEEQAGLHTPLPFDQGHTPLPPQLKKKTIPDAAPPRKRTPIGGTGPEDQIPLSEAQNPPEHKKRPRDEDPAERFRRPSGGKGVPDSARKTLAISEFKKRRARAKPVLSTMIGLGLLLIGIGVYGWFWMQKRSPGGKLTVAVENYLTALRAGHFDSAYEMLSSASRRSCTLGRFREVQAKGAWDSSTPTVQSQIEDHALLVYEISAAGKPREKDWLHFVRENGVWRRAYWWHLMDPIEEDLDSGDPESAFARAQTARKINPYDPMVAGYLCEAAYAQEAFELAERECLNAIALAEKNPSRLGDDGRFRLRRILADVYRSHLKKYPEALKQQQLLLASKLADEHRCAIQLAAADTHALSGDWKMALEGFSDASASCSTEEEIGYVRRNIRILSGKGAQDAVRLAQRHHMPGDPASLLEWRRQSRKDLARRLKTAAPIYDETWRARYASGPYYEVLVDNDGNPVLTAKVDLWTQTVRVKINVP